jgi:AmiR/NasT family two-component response regulator
MTAQRLIQNFRQSRGVLWAGADFAAETLEKTLFKLGVSLRRIEEVNVEALDHNRDILFVDGDLPLAPERLLGVGSPFPVAPAIGIVGVEAPSRLKLLAEAGVTALLRKPIHAATVYSALFLGVNNYRRLRALELRLAEQDRRRHGRRHVVKAVVALVKAHGLDDEEAYSQLRRESMRRRLGIEEFCAALLSDGSAHFPAAWPLRHETAGSSQGETRDASQFEDECRDDGHDGAGDDGAGDGPRRRSDQARRARGSIG